MTDGKRQESVSAHILREKVHLRLSALRAEKSSRRSFPSNPPLGPMPVDEVIGSGGGRDDNDVAGSWTDKPVDRASPHPVDLLEEESETNPGTRSEFAPSLDDIPTLSANLIWLLAQNGVETVDELAMQDPLELATKLGVISRLISVETWVSHAQYLTSLGRSVA